MNKLNDKLTRNSRKIYISIKLQADSNILASSEAGRGNCFVLPFVLAPGIAFLRVRRINISIKRIKKYQGFSKFFVLPPHFKK